MSSNQKGRGTGNKLRNNEVKLSIIRFLEDGKHSGVEIQHHLANMFGITQKRGVRKHLSELYNSMKFLERKEDGMDAMWRLKDDLSSYLAITKFVIENQQNVNWNVSKFTNDSKYGLRHINPKLIDWWIRKAHEKYCKCFNIVSSKTKTEQQMYDTLIYGIKKEQLVQMMQISPSVLQYIINVENIKSKDITDCHDRLIQLILRDVLDSNYPVVNAVKFASDIKTITNRNKKNIDGLQLDLSYEIYPKLESEDNKIANS